MSENSNFRQNPFSFGEGLYTRVHNKERYKTVEERPIDNPYLQENPFQKKRLVDSQSKFRKYRCSSLCNENQRKALTSYVYSPSPYQLKQRGRQLNHEDWRRQAYKEQQDNLRYYGSEGLRFYPNTTQTQQIQEESPSSIIAQRSMLQERKKQSLSVTPLEAFVWKPSKPLNKGESLSKQGAQKPNLTKRFTVNPEAEYLSEDQRSEDNENESLLNEANTSKMGYESDQEQSENSQQKMNAQTMAARSNAISGRQQFEDRPMSRSNVFLPPSFGKSTFHHFEIQTPNLKEVSPPPTTINMDGKIFHLIETN